MNKFYLIFSLFIFCYFKVTAEKYYSGPAGNWCTEKDGKGKCVSTPKEKDELIIDREISLRGPFSPKEKVKIENGGKLTITNAQSGTMDVQDVLEIENGGMLVIQKDLNFKNNSKVDIDEGGTILVAGDFENYNNSDKIKIDGKLEVGGNFKNGKHTKIQGNGKIAIAGSCDNNGEIFGVDNTCTGIKNLTLPVELLFFEAKVVGNAVQLYWATASEENFDYFLVERSIDAKEFSAVSENIKGAGNTTNISNYSFTDNSPYIGRSYYRLKAVDYDGSIEYHPVTTVTFTSDEVKIYPNPSHGNSINVSIGASTSNNSFLKIYNIIGEEVFRAKIHSGTNEYNFNQPLEKGLYILILEDGNNKKQTKLTVQ